MARPLSISPRPSGNPKLPWVVHIPEADRARYSGQQRRYFRREGEASTFSKVLRRERANHTAAFDQLPNTLKAQCHEALALLEPHGASIVQVCADFAAARVIAAKSRPLLEIIAELIKDKRADGRRERYLVDLQGKLAKFASAFPERLASEITSQDIAGWLRGGTLKPRSRDSYRRNIGVLFSWAKDKGYSPINPVAGTKAVNPRREHEVTILSPNQLRRMLQFARPELRPYIVFCAFAGLRPTECQRLTWDCIKAGALYVPKAVTKTVARRVEILPALATWIEFFGPMTGKVCAPYGTWRKQFRSCITDKKDEHGNALGAGIKPWPQDALRHSAISYWLAIAPNRAAVALWSGNSEAVQKRDYDNPRSPEEAAAWYAVLPDCLALHSPTNHEAEA